MRRLKGGKKMAKAERTGSMEPLPRYTMPDGSEPEYDLILDELYNDRRSLIGASYFYIKSDDLGCSLCRIIPGGGKIYFHEVVDHRHHGISDEDIELSARMCPGTYALPGHYPISPIIEKKLRVLLEFE
jgi:hypothetical protein